MPPEPADLPGAPEPFAVAVDVGGTNIRAARISRDGRILRKAAVAGSRRPDAALAIIAGLVAEMIGGGGLGDGGLGDGAPEGGAAGIGIGVPGRVDGRTGAVVSGGYLDLSGVDLGARLSGRFGLPVAVANDGSMALAGEAALGAGRGRRHLAMLTIGTGIGGALMQDGEVVHGSRHAGQLGHVAVDPDGRPCLCGRRGCVETESSGTALRRHLDEAGFDGSVRVADLLGAAEEGEPRALGVLRAWARPLQAAIGSLSAAFDPEAVLLGGGLGAAAHRALGHLPPLAGWYEVPVLAAALGDDAGIIGGGIEAFRAAARRAGARRLVLVNGVPASGKSAVAREISRRAGWPVLALDTVKDPFLELLDGVDRALNRRLGRASYKAIFEIVAAAPEGSTFVVDAWFGFQPPEVLRGHMARAGVTTAVEIWCACPPDVVGARYAARAGQRLPGHPGLAYVPELVELAARARPTGLAPVLTLDTTREIDGAAAAAWARERLGERLGGL